MGTDRGKLQLVVSSKRVLARIEEYDVSLRGLDGQLQVTRKTAKVFDYVLDEAQTRALEEARELARRSGLALEVTDLSRQDALSRMIRHGIGAINVLSGRGPLQLASASEASGKCQEGRDVVISPVSRP